MAGEWKKAYALVKTVPKGSVTTYGQVARLVKLPGGARAAGRAMAGCPKGLGIPWHRVVGAGGRIVISEPHAGLQRRLLESEGVRLIGGRRVDMAAHEWKPGGWKVRKTQKRKGNSRSPGLRASG